jgi:hydroxyacylglutathione hydrolase
MIELLSLPAFSDNYIWMVHNGREAVVVDPGDGAVVRQALAQRHLVLGAILVTHHHPDHTGGIQDLRDLLTGPVYAPAREQTPEPRQPVCGGQSFELLGTRVRVMDVPGHTAGHIAFVMEPEDQAPILFCGDTLFSGGCGRLFEGTAAQMHASLQALAALPGPTRVCCAHEYTLSNLRFASAVEPSNPQLAAYRQWCTQQRDRGEPTLPSTIENERQINPFLRCAEPEVRASATAQGAQAEDPVAVLAALREWKNRT